MIAFIALKRGDALFYYTSNVSLNAKQVKAPKGL
jgi:hypothetical protein